MDVFNLHAEFYILANEVKRHAYISIILIFISICMFSCWATLNAQIIYTRSFTEKLDELGLTFNQPAEQWWHLLPIERDSFFRYDLALDAAEEGYAIRYQFTPDEQLHFLPPPAAMQRALITAARNDPEAYIRVKELSKFELDRYNAEWGAIAEFRPKPLLSTYPKGKMLTIYRKNRALVLIMVFYETWNAQTEASTLSLMFEP